MSRISATTCRAFRARVYRHYRQQGRHDLPWRKTKDPYKILVSEVMLQQTQVERVVPLYNNFLKQFPTVQKLAKASLAEVLKSWQGLGYNRRAKMLRQAAKEVVEKHKGKFPKTRAELERLSGIGPYTAGAVVAFAYNHDVVFIETNIRTAVIHHFFSRRFDVADAELFEVLENAFPKGKSREWYSALMDYGAHLKKSGVKLNTKSKHYSKQGAFKGSVREARGAILRALSSGQQREQKLLVLLSIERREQAQKALKALIAEGLVVKRVQMCLLAT